MADHKDPDSIADDDGSENEQRGPGEVEGAAGDLDALAGEDDMADDPPEAETAATDPAQPAIVTERIVERRGSPLPLVAGGVVIAAVGFLAGQVNGPIFAAPERQGPDPALVGLTERVSALESAEPVDLAALTARIGEVSDALDGMSGETAAMTSELDAIAANLAALDARVEELEKQPAADGGVGASAIEAFQRDVDALRGQLDAARAETAAQLEAALARAAALEAEALSRQGDAEARTALADIEAALQNGQPFDAALGILDPLLDGGAPAALGAVAATGVATETSLRTAFPDAARAALAAARGAEDPGGVGAFLIRRLGLRSTAPREGDDPDAILSRAEAALEAGNLAAGLAELETLPETARLAMADWIAAARARAEALASAGALAAELGTN